MRRSFNGTSLALVLVALIAMKHAVLGFCLCSEQFFLSDCACESPDAVHECCGCEESPAAPCDDCEVSVSVEIDDFVWTATSFDPEEQPSTDLAFPDTPFADLTRGTDLAFTATPIRGSPPGAPPLYLLTSVLRL